jgi:hypothetical protein
MMQHSQQVRICLLNKTFSKYEQVGLCKTQIATHDKPVTAAAANIYAFAHLSSASGYSSQQQCCKQPCKQLCKQPCKQRALSSKPTRQPASPGLCGGPHLLQRQQQLQHTPSRVNRQQHTALRSTNNKTCAN